MQKRNRFVKGSQVKLLMCSDPGCKCQSKYTVGEDGVVINARGKHIVVQCSDSYEGLLDRTILFSKTGAARHLELISKPLKRSQNAPITQAVPANAGPTQQNGDRDYEDATRA